jgi:hypothetical protein
MSTPLIVGSPDMYIEDAARLIFKKNIKKLPIMENGKLVGILTLSDVARIVHIQSLVKVIRELSEKGWLPPKRMKKVIDIYIQSNPIPRNFPLCNSLVQTRPRLSSTSLTRCLNNIFKKCKQSIFIYKKRRRSHERKYEGWNEGRR